MNSDLAQEYVAATADGDSDAIAALSEPDVVVWHNFDGVEVDAATSARTLAWLHRTVPGLAWTDVRVTPTATGFVLQSTITGTAPGGPLLVPTCSVFTLSPAGKVARIEEYLDPAGLAPLSP